jgi:hypothetical protein
MPNPNSGSLASSTYVVGSGTRPDSVSSVQKRFEYPAK